MYVVINVVINDIMYMLNTVSNIFSDFSLIPLWYLVTFIKRKV
jgi:hypothetical protein